MAEDFSAFAHQISLPLEERGQLSARQVTDISALDSLLRQGVGTGQCRGAQKPQARKAEQLLGEAKLKAQLPQLSTSPAKEGWNSG